MRPNFIMSTIVLGSQSSMKAETVSGDTLVKVVEAEVVGCAVGSQPGVSEAKSIGWIGVVINIVSHEATNEIRTEHITNMITS